MNSVGNILSVTHERWKGWREIVHIDSIADNGYLNLSIIRQDAENEKPKLFEVGQNTMTVEPDWFDTEKTGRKFELMTPTLF